MITSEQLATPATPTPNRKQRSERSTALLLEAAGDLVVEGGYGAMTLAAVGERAGFSRGLVTARFGSKDKLLEALVARIVGGWSHRNVLPRTKGRPGRDGIIILLDAIRAQAERDQRALRTLYALMHEALGPQSELRRQFVQFHREMRADMIRLLRRGLKDGSVRKGIHPDDEAALIIAGLRGIAYQWALDPEAFDPVPVLAYLATTTEERLRP